MNFLHIPGQGLGVLLIRIFSKTEIRSFWVRTPNYLSVTALHRSSLPFGSMPTLLGVYLGFKSSVSVTREYAISVVLFVPRGVPSD